MNRKPYQNKTAYDPGRFRSVVKFFKQVSTPNGSGGSTLTKNEVYTCKGVKLPIRVGDQLVDVAGASIMNQDHWTVIRFYSGFTPEKDMNITVDGAECVIRAIVEIDIPVKYYRLLCIRKNG